MQRDTVINQLQQVQEQLTHRFGIRSLSLFGSFARDESTPTSDVDLLVEFTPPLTYDRYIQAKFYLEDLLGCPIDLVIPDTLKPSIRLLVEKEAVHVT